MSKQPAYATNATTWNYFKDTKAEPCPRGVKVQLLTAGGVAVYGHFTNDKDFMAWAPCIKRDKTKEAALGIR